MAAINFTITSGALPVAAVVSNADNTYVSQYEIQEYGSYSFSDLPTDTYTLVITDLDGCTSTKSISVIHECAEGEVMTVDGCVAYVAESPSEEQEPYIVAKSDPEASYTMYGGVIVTDYDIDGTGTVGHFDNDYVSNAPYPSTGGVLNDTGVWASTENSNQEIVLSTTIDVVVPTTYYIGFASGGEVTVKINGVEVISQDVSAIKDMIANDGLPGGYDNTVLYKYWFVYPIEIGTGKNVIEIIGNNDLGVSVIGVQIYYATEYEIINAQGKEDLNIIFSSEDIIEEVLPYEDSVVAGTHGYTCPEGYALDTSVDPPVCVQKAFTTLSTCGYGLLYNHHAVSDVRGIAEAGWHVPTQSEWETLCKYEDPAATTFSYLAGGAFREASDTYWNDWGYAATNKYGFSARGGGFRLSSGFQNFRGGMYAWSATLAPNGITNYVTLIQADNLFNFSGNASAIRGCAIRLIKDDSNNTGTYVDYDGNIYPTVKIGSQVWMAKGLSVTHFSNGDIIPWYGANPANYFTDEEWYALESPGVCAHYNDTGYVACSYFQFPSPATTTTTTPIPANTTTTTPDPLATTTTTTEGVFSFDVTYGNFPVDACDGTPITLYSSRQTPTVGTIMYLDDGLTQPYNISGGSSVRFVSPRLFNGYVVALAIVPVTYSMGEIMVVSSIICDPGTTTTTTEDPFATTTTTTEINYDTLERSGIRGFYKLISKNLIGTTLEIDITNLSVSEVQSAIRKFCKNAFSFSKKALLESGYIPLLEHPSSEPPFYFPPTGELFVGMPVYQRYSNSVSWLVSYDRTMILESSAQRLDTASNKNIFPCQYGFHYVIRVENGYIVAMTTINI